MEKNALGRKTFTGFIWTSVGTWGQGIVQVITMVILARLLMPSDFGLASAAMVIVVFGMLFAQLGVAPALVQRYELEEVHIRTGYTISLVLGASLGIATYLAADLIAGLFQIDGLAPLVRLTALAFPIQSLSVVAESLLQRNLRFRDLAITQTLAQFFGFGLVALTLALLGFGALALVIANIVQFALRATMLLLLSPHSKRPQFHLRAARELFYFGGGQTIARLGNQVASQADYIITGRWLGAEALGLYTRTYQLMALPATIIGTALDKVLFPSMARFQHDKPELARWFTQGSGAIALVTLPISAASFVLAPEIVLVLLGDQWTSMIPALQIFVFGMMFRTSYKISDSLARATGAVYRRAWRQSLYALAVILGAWVGQHWGIEGVATGVLGAVIFNFLLMSQLSLRLVDLGWAAFARVHGAPLLSGLLAGLVGFGAASLLRLLGLPAIVTLVGVGLVLLAGAALLVWARPPLLLGKEGLWLIDTVGVNLRRRPRPTPKGSVQTP